MEVKQRHAVVNVGKTHTIRIKSTKSIDVLCKHAAQDPFGVKKPQKMMCACRFILELKILCFMCLLGLFRYIDVWEQRFG